MGPDWKGLRKQAEDRQEPAGSRQELLETSPAEGTGGQGPGRGPDPRTTALSSPHTVLASSSSSLPRPCSSSGPPITPWAPWTWTPPLGPLASPPSPFHPASQESSLSLCRPFLFTGTRSSIGKEGHSRGQALHLRDFQPTEPHTADSHSGPAPNPAVTFYT